jgi:hypothetical protein
MDGDQVLWRICKMPLDFYGGSKSMLQLVSESGIDAHPQALTVTRLIACLKDHPELVEQWLHWSANKRVTSGWYFARKAGGLVVEFYPKGESFMFEDPVLACAEFVVREVREIAAMSRRKN